MTDWLHRSHGQSFLCLVMDCFNGQSFLCLVTGGLLPTANQTQVMPQWDACDGALGWYVVSWSLCHVTKHNHIHTETQRKPAGALKGEVWLNDGPLRWLNPFPMDESQMENRCGHTDPMNALNLMESVRSGERAQYVGVSPTSSCLRVLSHDASSVGDSTLLGHGLTEVEFHSTVISRRHWRSINKLIRNSDGITIGDLRAGTVQPELQPLGATLQQAVFTIRKRFVLFDSEYARLTISGKVRYRCGRQGRAICWQERNIFDQIPQNESMSRAKSACIA